MTNKDNYDNEKLKITILFIITVLMIVVTLINDIFISILGLLIGYLLARMK